MVEEQRRSVQNSKSSKRQVILRKAGQKKAMGVVGYPCSRGQTEERVGHKKAKKRARKIGLKRTCFLDTVCQETPRSFIGKKKKELESRERVRLGESRIVEPLIRRQIPAVGSNVDRQPSSKKKGGIAHKGRETPE